ncbi:MAG: trigger factor [Rhodobacteraceae bacterium]|nr:trigger factor [Paracoccaceae bacterium]
MQVIETLKDGLKRGYEITVTAQELDAKVQAKLAEAQPNIAMKGFRKGHVPIALLRKQYGRQLLGEAMQEAVDAAMKRHFDATGDRPALQPDVSMKTEGWKEGDDVVVSLAYEALPAIPEADLGKISLEKLVVEPDDEAVDEALDKLAQNAGSFADRKKGSKAKEGDQVVIDFVGRIGGEAFQGGAAEDFALVLGSGSFIPGFEDQLLGVKAGEQKTVEVTFPESYGNRELAGKAAVFEVTVKAVKEPVKAALDDALAARFGAENLEALKGQIRERLKAEYEGAARAVMKRALLDALDSEVRFDLPPSLVEAEANQIAHQLWHEEHPEEQGHAHGHIEPTEEHVRLAERRVRLGLLLAEIGNRAEVKVTDAEMAQAVMSQARQYPGQERAFFEFVQKNARARQAIHAPVFEDKVVDHIFSVAKVTEKKATKEELKKAVEKLDEL